MGGKASLAPSTDRIRVCDMVQLLYGFLLRRSIEVKQMLEVNSVFQLELMWIKIIIDS